MMTPEIPSTRPEGLDHRGKVIVLKLKDSDKVYRLNKSRIVIGSIVSADIRLQGEGVSPIHAVLEIGDDHVGIIYDLASDSGVFVNGKKIVTQVLGQNETFTVGRYTFTFSLEDVAAIAKKSGREDFTRLLDGSTLFFDPKEDFKSLMLEDERVVEDIFDYGSTSKKALEVIMAWNPLRSQSGGEFREPLILDVEHFVREKNVTLGAKASADFGIPPLLGEKRYPLVTRSGDGFTLNLSNEMQGVISRKGQMVGFADLRKAANNSQIPLEGDDFAKVSLGDLDFYLSYTAAPPKLKRRGFEKDFLFYKVMAASLLFTGIFIAALTRIQVTDQIEAEQIPERVATILYNPQKFTPPRPIVPTKAEKEKTAPEQPKTVEAKPKPPEPKPKETVKVELKPQKIEPKPVPEKMKVAPEKPNPKDVKVAQTQQNKANARAEKEAKEGEGARAKGKEGARGDKKAAPGKNKQSAAFRPSPQGGDGRGAGNSQVADEGNIDVLKGVGAKIQDLLGNSGENLGKGGEKLKGFGGFSTRGEGGLALQGGGKGGGGTADTTLGGLGNKGTGGGRVGTGKGAAGNGSGIVGGQSRVSLRTGGAEETVVMGSIDKNAILAALLAHKDEFRLCYEREINAETPSAAGTVTPSVVLGSTGRATQASIDSSTLNNANVERCILTVMRRIQFPIPEGGGTVQFTYPFKFSPAGG